MNMDWRSVPVPARMAHLPRDRRGYPVPEMIQRAADGTPLFTANDVSVVHHHLAHNLCGICGGEIEVGEFHFVGGPLSAFHPQGAYLDGPLHAECGQYALQVCPYIAVPRFTKRIDPESVAAKMGPGVVNVDQTMLAEKPECFVMIRCLSFNVTIPLSHASRFRPIGDPFAEPGSASSRMLDFEVWKDGAQIMDEAEATGMIRVGIQRAQAQQVQKPRIIGVQPVAKPRVDPRVV